MKSLFACTMLVALLVLNLKISMAQQVVASSGESLANSSGSLSFTLGELAIETKSGSPGILTEGFHQPTITITSLDEPVKVGYSITAFPNPTSDFVNLEIENEELTGLSYILYDATGKDILSGTIENKTTEISFSELKTAIYFLKIETDGKLVKTFKISKE
jgi:hypothetical protein